MSDVQIYHNPRCSKSRIGLAYLIEKGITPEIVLYLTNTLTANQLKDVLVKLKMKPIELVRTNEAIYKNVVKDNYHSDDELIQWMIEHPQLIERPIVVKKEKAVIARPVEKIDELLKD
jgi:arsenate reductase